jgi:hypothetical protein
MRYASKGDKTMNDELRERAEIAHDILEILHKYDWSDHSQLASSLTEYTAEAIRAERERVATKLHNDILEFNRDTRHNADYPCLVCDILNKVAAISVELREAK